MDRLSKMIFDDMNKMNMSYRKVLLRIEEDVKLQKCAKCGCLYPESTYDCPGCHYSSGGD